MVSCGSDRPRSRLSRGHLWGELPLSQGTDTSQPCCSLCGVEIETQRGRRGQEWEAALRVEGTGQCLGHRHTQSVILEGAPAWEETELRGRKTAGARAEHGAREQGLSCSPQRED